MIKKKRFIHILLGHLPNSTEDKYTLWGENVSKAGELIDVASAD